LGDALRRLEMLDEANVALQQAVARFPQTRRLRFYLAQTLGSLGRYDDAETQYKVLLDTRPR
jgi:tetratricopeptide (TPR) repeat protein